MAKLMRRQRASCRCVTATTAAAGYRERSLANTHMSRASLRPWIPACARMTLLWGVRRFQLARTLAWRRLRQRTTTRRTGKSSEDERRPSAVRRCRLVATTSFSAVCRTRLSYTETSSSRTRGSRGAMAPSEQLHGQTGVAVACVVPLCRRATATATGYRERSLASARMSIARLRPWIPAFGRVA
jgi:hypothetical protein